MAERETEALRGKKWPRDTQHVGAGSRPGRWRRPPEHDDSGQLPSQQVPPRVMWLLHEAPSCPHDWRPAAGQLLTACYRGPNTWDMGKTGETGLGLGLEPASCSSFSPSLAPFHHCFFFPGESEGWA